MRIKFLLMSLGLFTAVTTQAAVHLSHRHEAGTSASGEYATEGFFAGGNKAVTAARLTNIRFGGQGSERIVLDLEGQSESPNSVPYFQVHAAPQEGHVVVSIWADVAYDYNGKQIQKAFTKSKLIKKINVVPRLEDGLTMIQFVLNPKKNEKNFKFKAFHLAKPSRIVIDMN